MHLGELRPLVEGQELELEEAIDSSCILHQNHGILITLTHRFLHFTLFDSWNHVIIVNFSITRGPMVIMAMA